MINLKVVKKVCLQGCILSCINVSTTYAAGFFFFFHFSSEKFKFVVTVLSTNKFSEYDHYIRMVIVLILHVSSSQAFDEPSINPPETSDVVTSFFNRTVKHEVQPWDSLVPHCGSIVNFLTAWRHTTHITYFLTARPFESVHGWTIFNLSVSDHPLVAGPLAAHSPPQWQGHASRIWYRAGSQGKKTKKKTAQFTSHKSQTSLEDVSCTASQRLCRPQCHSGSINYLHFELVGFM